MRDSLGAREAPNTTGLLPDEPSKSPSTGRLRRLVLGGLVAVACGLVGVAVCLQHVPDFYRERIATGDAEIAAVGEQDSRRLLTKLSALHGAFVQPGPWEAAISEREINAWLRTDLPRNHSRLLPSGLAEPQVELGSKRVRAAIRVGSGLFSAVASLDVEVLLRDVNQLGIVLEDARLGALPLPRGPILREIARRIAQLGMVTELRRLDGRTVLVVYIPSTHEAGMMSHWLQSLALQKGEVLVSGLTRQGVERLRADVPAAR